MFVSYKTAAIPTMAETVTGLVRDSAHIWDYIVQMVSKSYFHIFGDTYVMEIVDYDFSEFNYGMCIPSSDNERGDRTQCQGSKSDRKNRKSQNRNFRIGKQKYGHFSYRES